jgi:peroxiredoxin
MSKIVQRRVLLVGILSPLAAVLAYTVVYGTLTQLSRDLERDWLIRLSLSALAMTVPFFVTLALAVQEGRRQPLARSSKLGLAIALLSLGLIAEPIHDGILRAKQIRNLTMRGVAAPAFDTPDIVGNSQRLVDHRGEVALVNIWATWCAPCRSEMPKLDQLYRERKDKGFIVFGMSDESVEVQRKFLEQVSVSYPLLTLSGQVPSLYRDIARYPAIFLIDREGRLQPLPGPDKSFEQLAAAVDALLEKSSR